MLQRTARCHEDTGGVGNLTIHELYPCARYVGVEEAGTIQLMETSLNAHTVEERDRLEWSDVIQRYVSLAKLAKIDSTHRKFAINRWIHRKRGAGGTLTVEDWEAMLEATGGCYFCGSTESITMEHLMPRSIGGGFTPENIVPACKWCNRARGNTFNASIDLFLAIDWSPKRE
jgi:5-methylcytosine-specific restriction endonuclease McrA